MISEATMRGGRLAVVTAVAGTVLIAAGAFWLSFTALEEHVAELWCDARHGDEPGVRALGDTVASAAFRRRLAVIGG